MNFYDLIFKGEVGHSTRMGWWENILGEFIGGVSKLIAKFLKIKGNTLVWNQFINSSTLPSTQTSSGITITNNGDGSLTVNGTNTGSSSVNVAVNSLGVQFPQGDKLLLIGSSSMTGWGGFALFDVDKGSLGAVGNNGYVLYSNPSASINKVIRVAIWSGVAVNNVKFYPQLFNLTKMFGSTKADEIYAMEQSESGSGVAYFRSLYPLPYYQYNVGSLLSFNGEGIKTTSANLMPKLTEGTYTLNGIAATVDADGYIKITGNPYTSGTTLTIPFDEPFTLNKDLYCHCFNDVANASITPTFGSWYFSLTPVNRILVTNPNYDGTTVTNLRMYVGANTNPNITLRPMFTYSSEVMEYVEHEESSSTLPISDYFPTGMKGWGTAFDELTNSKATHRMAEYTFTGNESWTASATPNRFSTTISNYLSIPMAPQSTNANAKQNVVTDKYGGFVYVNQDKGAYSYYLSSSGTVVVINDSSLSTVADVQTATTGMVMQYETATELVVDIDPPLKLNYQVWEGGTEQLLPVNTDNPTTSPILADINYPDGERDDQYFTYRQYLPNNQLLGMALNTLMGKNVPFNQEALDILMKGE